MDALSPVAQNRTMPTETTALAVTSVRENGPITEQRLLDYLMRFQAEGLVKAQHLANPAAMSGEAIMALKGYFERTSALYDSAARKAQVMNESGDGIMSGGNNQLPALPAGPARERLEPTMSQTGLPAERVAGITDAELSRAVNMLVEIMHYGMETAMVTTATNNVSKSAMTLTRGQ